MNFLNLVVHELSCHVAVNVLFVRITGVYQKMFGLDDAEGRSKEVSSDRPEFVQDHESGLRSDWGPVFLQLCVIFRCCNNIFHFGIAHYYLWVSYLGL